MKPTTPRKRRKINVKAAPRAIGNFFKSKKEALKVGLSILGDEKIQSELGKTIIQAGLKKRLEQGKLSKADFDYYSNQMGSKIYVEFAKAYGLHFAINIIPVGVPGKFIVKPGLMVRSRKKAKKAFENKKLTQKEYEKFVRLHNLFIPLAVSMIPLFGGLLAYPTSLLIAQLKKKPIIEADFVFAAMKGARMHMNKEGYKKLRELATRIFSEK